MTIYEEEPKRYVSSQMLDPVEHAVVEATWGEVFTRKDPVLQQTLGAVPIRSLIEGFRNR